MLKATAHSRTLVLCLTILHVYSPFGIRGSFSFTLLRTPTQGAAVWSFALLLPAQFSVFASHDYQASQRRGTRPEVTSTFPKVLSRCLATCILRDKNSIVDKGRILSTFWHECWTWFHKMPSLGISVTENMAAQPQPPRSFLHRALLDGYFNHSSLSSYVESRVFEGNMQGI